MPTYIIESTQAKQYWNEHGPVRGWLPCREDATEFTQEQRDAGGLPNRGCWVIVNEPDVVVHKDGDPHNNDVSNLLIVPQSKPFEIVSRFWLQTTNLTRIELRGDVVDKAVAALNAHSALVKAATNALSELKFWHSRYPKVNGDDNIKDLNAAIALAESTELKPQD